MQSSISWVWGARGRAPARWRRRSCGRRAARPRRRGAGVVRRPSGRPRPLPHPLDLVDRKPGADADPLVMSPLVLAIVRWATRRITSSVSRPRQRAPRHQPPGEAKPGANSRRWRPRVVKMRGGAPPVARPINRAIAQLTKPSFAPSPGNDARLPAARRLTHSRATVSGFGDSGAGMRRSEPQGCGLSTGRAPVGVKLTEPLPASGRSCSASSLPTRAASA